VNAVVERKKKTTGGGKKGISFEIVEKLREGVETGKKRSPGRKKANLPDKNCRTRRRNPGGKGPRTNLGMTRQNCFRLQGEDDWGGKGCQRGGA